MLLALVSVGLAEPIAEEVVVWEKPFARFDDKRWLVRSEVVTPARMPLGTSLHPVNANAWQVEAVIHCKLDGKRGRLREANCTFEEAAVRVHASEVTPGSRQEEDVVALAEELVGARLQLQVNRGGGVPSTDLEGWSSTGKDKRMENALRSIMSQVSAAFHLDVPDGDLRGKEWQSKREPLMNMASSLPGLSSIRVTHRVDPHDDLWIQQSQGRSLSTVPRPNPNAGQSCRVKSLMDYQGDTAPTSKAIIRPGDKPSPTQPTGSSGNLTFAAMGFVGAYDPELGECPPGMRFQPDHLDGQDLSYQLQLTGVTAIDPGAGFPIERVWSVVGQPTSSSAGTLTGTTYWSAGKIRLLDAEEGVTLGRSGAVGAPRDASHPHPWLSVAG